MIFCKKLIGLLKDIYKCLYKQTVKNRQPELFLFKNKTTGRSLQNRETNT